MLFLLPFVFIFVEVVSIKSVYKSFVNPVREAKMLVNFILFFRNQNRFQPIFKLKYRVLSSGNTDSMLDHDDYNKVICVYKSWYSLRCGKYFLYGVNVLCMLYRSRIATISTHGQ